MKINWITVLRDALGVLLLGFLGGLVGGAIGDDSDGSIRTASVIVLMTAGFCLSGCLAKQSRFKHLALVAAGVWLIGMIVSVTAAEGNFILGLSDIGLIVAAMLLGGLISLAIVKPPPAAAPSDATPPAKPPPADPPPA